MSAKDALARGARSATYSYVGERGEAIELRNVSTEPREDVATVAPTKPAVRRKKFVPLGATILVRQVSVEKEGIYTDQESALKDKTHTIVAVTSEEELKKDVPSEGTVVAVGPGTDEYPMTVSVGDDVVFGKYAGAAYNHNGEWMLLMQVNEILGILEDEVEIETYEQQDNGGLVRVVAEA